MKPLNIGGMKGNFRWCGGCSVRLGNTGLIGVILRDAPVKKNAFLQPYTVFCVHFSHILRPLYFLN